MFYFTCNYGLIRLNKVCMPSTAVKMEQKQSL